MKWTEKTSYARYVMTSLGGASTPLFEEAASVGPVVRSRRDRLGCLLFQLPPRATGEQTRGAFHVFTDVFTVSLPVCCCLFLT